MRLGRDNAPDGVNSVLSGLPWPLVAVMPVTLRSCSKPGHEEWPKPNAQFDPAWSAKFRRHSRPATSEKVRYVLGNALKAERAAYKALERARGAPGSIEDIERVEAMWTMLRTMARLALERCDEALPAAA
jgi:hypothetical protein